jgi:hypothetical protein
MYTLFALASFIDILVSLVSSKIHWAKTKSVSSDDVMDLIRINHWSGVTHYDLLAKTGIVATER